MGKLIKKNLLWLILWYALPWITFVALIIGSAENPSVGEFVQHSYLILWALPILNIILSLIMALRSGFNFYLPFIIAVLYVPIGIGTPYMIPVHFILSLLVFFLTDLMRKKRSRKELITDEREDYNADDEF